MYDICKGSIKTATGLLDFSLFLAEPVPDSHDLTQEFPSHRLGAQGGGFIQRHDAPHQDIEDGAECEGNHGAGENDDIVRHAEVGGRQRKKKTSRPDVDRRLTCGVEDADNGGRDVEAAVCIWRVLGIAQDGLFKVVGEGDGRCSGN